MTPEPIPAESVAPAAARPVLCHCADGQVCRWCNIECNQPDRWCSSHDKTADHDTPPAAYPDGE